MMVRFAQFPPTWDLVVSYFKQQELAMAGEINFMQVCTLFCIYYARLLRLSFPLLHCFTPLFQNYNRGSVPWVVFCTF
jgi:hypothetical protein